MINSNNILRTKKKVESAIELIQQEIDLHEKNMGTVSNVAQLEKIAISLDGMLSSLNTELPSWEYIGFGRLIADSWPMQSVLGAKLLEAEQEYRKLLK